MHTSMFYDKNCIRQNMELQRESCVQFDAPESNIPSTLEYVHQSRTNIQYVLTATWKAGYAWHLPWRSSCMIHKIYHLVPILFHVRRPKPTWIHTCSSGLYGRIGSQWVFGNCDCRLVVAHCHVTLPYIVSRQHTLSTIDPNCHILEHAGLKIKPIPTTYTTKIIPSACAISLAYYEWLQNQFPALSTGWIYSSDVSLM